MALVAIVVPCHGSHVGYVCGGPGGSRFEEGSAVGGDTAGPSVLSVFRWLIGKRAPRLVSGSCVAVASSNRAIVATCRKLENASLCGSPELA